MSDPQQQTVGDDFSPLFADLALARRVESAEAQVSAAYADAHARLYPAVGATAVALAGGYAIYAGVDSPLSRTVGLGLHGPVSAADLAQVEAFYSRRGAPSQVDLCPLADPSLLTLLRRRGYRPFEFNNVWVRAPGGPQPAPTPAVPVRAIEPAEAGLWARVVAQGFASRDEVTEAELAVALPFYYVAGVTCFLAWVAGEPAGGATMALHRGLAALFLGSTRPAWRRRGAQTALLRTRLALAATAASDLIMVQTEPGSESQRNVQRLGFRLAYTKLTVIRA